MEKDLEKIGLKESSEREPSEKNVVEISREPAAASARLEAIQDILFGEQLRSSNDQISELQKNSEQTLADLSKSIDQRFDELTNSMNSKIDSLVKQLNDQKNVQHETDERLSDGLSVCKAALTQSINSTREDLTRQMSQVAGEMEAKKLDSGKLSQMFTQVAQELATQSTSTSSTKS